MKTVDYIEAISRIKDKSEVSWVIIQTLLLAFNNDFLDSEKISFYKQDIASYYKVDIKTLNKWIELFVNDANLKEALLHKGKQPISYEDFKMLAQIIGYSNVFLTLPKCSDSDNGNYIYPEDYWKDIDEAELEENNNVNIKNLTNLYNKNKLRVVEYKAYSKSELINIIEEKEPNSTLYDVVRNDLYSFFKINTSSLNIYPPKQSYDFISYILGSKLIDESVVIFNLPKISLPHYRKSQMPIEKRIKKLLIDNQIFESTHYYNKAIDSIVKH